MTESAIAQKTPPKKHGQSYRWITALIPYSWLIVFFLIPFFLVFKISLSQLAISIPPYSPVFDLTEGWNKLIENVNAFSIDNYIWLTQDSLYWRSYLSSVMIAFNSTCIALLIGYPIAYSMTRASPAWRFTLLMLVILPFWTSFLIRVYAWIGILKKEGLLNQFLLAIGILNEPLTILNTNAAVYVGIVYTYLPFMVLPLYAALERMDDSLLEAAKDLGCTAFKAFWLITIPLSLPGIVAGCMLVFIPAVGEFVIPDLLGGSETLMIGKTLWVEFFSNRDWPVSSAVAVVLLMILVLPIVYFQRQQVKSSGAI